MKSRLLRFSAMAALVLTSTQAFAALPNQPSYIPEDGDYGVYAVQEQSLGDADPDLAKAYDNFTITGPGYDLTGISWSGIYAEPLPGAVSDIDFLVEIWGDASGVPDLDAGPIFSKYYEDGNSIGEAGTDLTVVGNAEISPSTATTPGGGPGANYVGTLPGLAPASFSGNTTLMPGDYWISIIASQTFENPDPVVDPEWQWRLGDGPNDGFYARDRILDPEGTPEYGLLIEDYDLAFALHGEALPEPSSCVLALMGFLTAGMARRRR